MSYHLGGREFRTKRDIIGEVRSIVARATLRQPLTGQDFDLLCDLFKNHPDADEKIGPGIAEIHVRQAVRNRNNREF